MGLHRARGSGADVRLVCIGFRCEDLPCRLGVGVLHAGPSFPHPRFEEGKERNIHMSIHMCSDVNM